MASVAEPETAPPASTRRWTPGRVAVVLVVTALVAMWAYAFSGAARRESPLRVADRRWAADAEAACRPMVDAIAELPPARTATSPEGRAVVLREANAEVAAAVDRLAAVDAPADAGDRTMVERWLADWHTYLGDRERYAGQLAAGEDVPFRLTAVKGQAVTEQMDEFAAYNELEACRTPDDV